MSPSGEDQTATSEKTGIKKRKTTKEEERKEQNALVKQKERQIRDVIAVAMGH